MKINSSTYILYYLPNLQNKICQVINTQSHFAKQAATTFVNHFHREQIMAEIMEFF